MKTNILNINFDTFTRNQALEKTLNFLGENKNHMIFTPNPEMVMYAQKDKDFLKILNKADLTIPDGIGIVLASKLNKIKIEQRVAGCDLVYSIFDKISDKGYNVYLLGGDHGVCENAKKNIELKYNIKIVGFHHGYFNENDSVRIISDINHLETDILLVGLGFPKQEKWIYENRNLLKTKICIGVGGTLDVLSGKVNRAPVFYQNIGMEWLYRLFKQPSRIVRVIQIPIFILNVIKFKIIKK